jgi:hypothetical protein
MSEPTIDNWKPPKNPDPNTILQEATADTRAKRYKVALAKHVWYFNNALHISPSQFGVRLSFALSYWKELGEAYPPAMATLRSIRDGLEQQAKKGENLERAVPDLAAINRTLGEDARTTSVFKVLDANYPESANQAFHWVTSALITEKGYKLYGKYINPSSDFLRIKHAYEASQELSKDPRFGSDHSASASRYYRKSCATLVAILVVNNRKAEAHEIAVRAENEVPKEGNDPQFQQAIKSALSGIVPTPLGY